MKRFIDYKSNLNIHWLKDMEKEYCEIEKEQILTLLKKANSREFNSHYNKLEEIKNFRIIIEESIDEINNLLLN